MRPFANIENLPPRRRRRTRRPRKVVYQKRQRVVKREVIRIPEFIKIEEAKPMTWSEMWQLNLGLKKIPDDRLKRVVLILINLEPSMMHADPYDIDMDIETLSPPTLRELEGYVNYCLPKEPLEKIYSWRPSPEEMNKPIGKIRIRM